MAIFCFGRRGFTASFTTAAYLPEPEFGRSPIACGIHAAISNRAITSLFRALVGGQDLNGQVSHCLDGGLDCDS